MVQSTNRRGFGGADYHYDQVTVTLASNTGSVDVTFTESYDGVPDCFVVKPRGAAGNYSAVDISDGGFTISVTSETDTDFDDQDVVVTFFVHQR